MAELPRVTTANDSARFVVVALIAAVMIVMLSNTTRAMADLSLANVADATSVVADAQGDTFADSSVDFLAPQFPLFGDLDLDVDVFDFATFEGNYGLAMTNNYAGQAVQANAIPTPSAALLGFAGLGIVGSIRRKHMA